MPPGYRHMPPVAYATWVPSYATPVAYATWLLGTVICHPWQWRHLARRVARGRAAHHHPNPNPNPNANSYSRPPGPLSAASSGMRGVPAVMQDMSSVRGSESGPDIDIRTKVFCKKRGLRLAFPIPARGRCRSPFSSLSRCRARLLYV